MLFKFRFNLVFVLLYVYFSCILVLLKADASAADPVFVAHAEFVVIRPCTVKAVNDINIITNELTTNRKP